MVVKRDTKYIKFDIKKIKCGRGSKNLRFLECVQIEGIISIDSYIHMLVHMNFWASLVVQW